MADFIPLEFVETAAMFRHAPAGLGLIGIQSATYWGVSVWHHGHVPEFVPRWLKRPTGPGLWVCVGGRGGALSGWTGALQLSQLDLDRGAPFETVAVFGPIPKRPESFDGCQEAGGKPEAG